MGKGGKERYVQIASSEILGVLKNYYKRECRRYKTE